jgi:hypothetical protein
MHNRPKEIPSKSEWRMAAQAAEQLPCILTMHYLTRLSDVHSTVVDLLKLHSTGAADLAKEHARTLRTLLGRNPQLWATEDGKARDLVKNRVNEFTSEAVSRRPVWIINQGLVTSVTFFEGFLENVVDIIYREKVDLLCQTRPASDISLKEVVAKGTQQGIDDVRSEEVHRFTFLSGIRKRMGYMESKLGIPVSALFDWSTFESPEQYEEYDLNKLADIYEKRNAVVHSEELPLEQLNQLSVVSDFLGKLVLNISGEARSKHGVLLDMNRMMLQTELYKKIIGSSPDNS